MEKRNWTPCKQPRHGLLIAKPGKDHKQTCSRVQYKAAGQIIYTAIRPRISRNNTAHSSEDHYKTIRRVFIDNNHRKKHAINLDDRVCLVNSPETSHVHIGIWVSISLVLIHSYTLDSPYCGSDVIVKLEKPRQDFCYLITNGIIY